MAILRFFAGVFEHLSTEQARTFLPHVLNPLHRILDENGELASTNGEVNGLGRPAGSLMLRG
jgi:U3 small nucleolar RNA-associated protein 20